MLTAVAASFLVLIGASAGVSAAIDPEWAAPINTLLLLLTAIAAAIINRSVQRVEVKADRNHETGVQAANAAASAADAAAAAARITKELGAAARNVDPGRIPTTDPTVPTSEGGGP